MVSLAGSFFWGQALAYVSQQSLPDKQSRDQGYNGLLQGASAFISVLLAGHLIDLFGFTGTYMVAACISFTGVLFSINIRENISSTNRMFSFQEISISYRNAFTLLKNTKIQLSTIFSTIAVIINHAIGNTFFPMYAVLVNKSTARIIGSYLGSRNLTAMLISLSFGFFANKMGKYRPLIIGQGLAIATTPLIPLLKYPISHVVLFSVQGAGMGFIPAGPNVLLILA
jgi:MFS family permease